MKKHIKIKALFLIFFCSACSFNMNNKPALNDKSKEAVNYEKSGMIAIAESIPQTKNDLTPEMLSFLSTDDEILDNWLLINTEENTINIKKGNKTLNSFRIKENIGLRPGMYSVFYKELNPLWYANDNYYFLRQLPVPDKESQKRYVKGALGDCAIYLNDKMAIHDSKISSLDVEGIRVDSNDIRKIYASLKAGALIKVY